MKISKRVTVLLLLAAFVFFALSAMRIPSKPQHFSFHNITDTSGTNLKILPQNISPDSLYHLMEGYESALGINCGHCHVMKDKDGKEDYASDSLQTKSTARRMMLMTDSLNRSRGKVISFLQPVTKITCITCHKGKLAPENGFKVY